MCNSQFGGGCCPPAQIFREKICGNFNGPLTTPGGVEVWSAPAGAYFAGTFELFNSASSPATVTAAGTAAAATPIALSSAPGNTDSISVNQPTSFTITAAAGDNGTYCITLYKRVLA